MTHAIAYTPSLPGSPVPDFLWGVADVREARPDLDPRQAWEVLKLASAEQHPACGITEDLLLYAAEELYGLDGAGSSRAGFGSSLAQRSGGAA
jgi:hypothetical protein